MLEVGNGGMTGDEYRTHMSLWALLAAPLLAGNDLSKMTEETKSILMNKRVIAIDQDSLGVQGKRMSKDGDLEIWTKPLSGGAVAVGLFNRGTSATEMTLILSDLGLKPEKAKSIPPEPSPGAARGTSTVGGVRLDTVFAYSPTSKSAQASVKATPVAPSRLHVLNVWTGSPVVETNGVVTEPVPAHGVVLLRVEP